MSEHLRTVVEKVRHLAEPLVAGEGMELVDVEYARDGGRWVLRIYIYKTGGVGLEDCQRISRQMDTVLDVEDFIETEYSLEVSSPGIERPLRTPAHFERFVGRQVEVKTFAPIGEPPRKNYRGKLLGISTDQVVTVECEGKPYQVPLDKIAKAHLAFDFDAFEENQGPGLPRPKKKN
jgi:ribosome maturation factor RimP